MSAVSTLASLHTVSRGSVVVASLPRHPEARRVIGAGSAIVTTGDGIGLRSGGFGPSRNPPARTLIGVVPRGMPRPRCVDSEPSHGLGEAADGSPPADPIPPSLGAPATTSPTREACPVHERERGGRDRTVALPRSTRDSRLRVGFLQRWGRLWRVDMTSVSHYGVLLSSIATLQGMSR